MTCNVWIGFDPREAAAFAVARHSINKHLTQQIQVKGLILSELQEAGLYTRPTTIKTNDDGHIEMIDKLSIRPDFGGRISTQHAIARFLVPHIAGADWALFVDGDVLFRANVARLFEGLDHKYAVYCVKHKHVPKPGTKMDGQEQTQYARKNWSSFMIWNCGHEANKALTLDAINTLPGKDLHRFAWLDDSEIGELDPAWNFLVGHSDPSIEPKMVHFTSGTPDMAGYESQPYADEWRKELEHCEH